MGEDFGRDIERACEGSSVNHRPNRACLARGPFDIVWRNAVSKRALSLVVFLAVLSAIITGCGPVSPSVQGLALAPAEQRLESAGLRVGEVTYDGTATEATGTVVAQNPPAGRRTKKGSTVALTVAGPQPVGTPALVGTDKDAAMDALAAANLLVGPVTERHSSTVDAGRVVEQSPAAGALVPPASPVALVMSSGPESVRIPIVKGRTESRARARLKSAGFKVKVVRAGSAEERGTVIAQKPSGGKARPGKTVTITISTGGSSGGADRGSAAGDGASEGDAAAARAFKAHKSGIRLEGEGTVARVLKDDSNGSRHQRFILRLASGQTLLIAHNIDIAPRVPSLSPGDSVAFSGIYEWNSEGGTVHWTHHDPDGEHRAGWLEHDGTTYE